MNTERKLKTDFNKKRWYFAIEEEFSINIALSNIRLIED